MNLNRADAISLVQDLASVNVDGVDVAVCPPFVYLDAVLQSARGSSLGVGAQNMYHEAKGAYTGEISASMLTDLGCQYVILGHSERRNILGESNEDVNRKLLAALDAGITPIVCVGELIEQRNAGQTLEVIAQQFEGSFANVTPQQASICVIAYEPVWAIGTGLTATPEQDEEVHSSLRLMLQDRFGPEVADSIRIQYGGSVTPDNASALLTQTNIDGALVGGASLSVEKFVPIIHAAAVSRATA
jgi:triosephosphate isomerase